MNYQKLIDFWGANNLNHAKCEALSNANIPEESKRFLIEIGLPHKLDLFYSIKFSLEHDILPRLDIRNYSSQEQSQGLEQFIIIGLEDDSAYICINELNQGYVYSVGLEDNILKIYLINSSVQQLAECLFLYQTYRLKAERENICNDEEKYYKLTEKLEEEIDQVDPQVFDSEDNWWVLILEQMYEGLL